MPPGYLALLWAPGYNSEENTWKFLPREEKSQVWQERHLKLVCILDFSFPFLITNFKFLQLWYLKHPFAPLQSQPLLREPFLSLRLLLNVCEMNEQINEWLSFIVWEKVRLWKWANQLALAARGRVPDVDWTAVKAPEIHPAACSNPPMIGLNPLMAFPMTLYLFHQTS